MHNSLVNWKIFRNMCDLGNDAAVKGIDGCVTWVTMQL